MTCRYCGNPIEPGPTPTGWYHRSVAWLGARCPNGARYAEPSPVEDLDR